MAAAIGAGLPIAEPLANVVVDIGGGTSEVAVISLGGIVVSRSLRVGGYDFDEALAGFIRRHHRLAIGETTSEAVKLEVGGCSPDESEAETEVRGRDPATGLPREAKVTSAETREALEPLVTEIIDAVKDALENTPPELAADLTRRGILLAGGGALLRGFAERLQDGDARAGGAGRRPAHLRRAGRGPRARGDRRAGAGRALGGRALHVHRVDTRYSPLKRSVPSSASLTSFR